MLRCQRPLWRLSGRLANLPACLSSYAISPATRQKKLASNSRAKESAAKVARVVGDEARQIAREEDKARAAGRALRRAKDKIQGDQ